MPQIPIYQQRIGASGHLGPGPETIPQPGPSTASLVGTALNAVDQSLETVATVSAAKALSSIRLKSEQRFLDTQVDSKAADNFTPQVLSGFDKDVQDSMSEAVGKGVTSSLMQGYVKRLVLPRAQQIRDDLATRSLRFEAEQNVAKQIATTESSREQARVAVELNPDSWQTAGAEQMAAIDALKIPPDQRLALKRRVDADLSEAAATGFAKRDPAGVLMKLQTAKSGDMLFDGLSLDARQRVATIAKNKLVQQQVTGIMGAYQAGGMEAGAKAMGTIDKSGLPPDLQDNVRAQVNSQVTQLRTQRREEHADDLARIESAIQTDTASRDTANQVHQLFSLGALTPAEYASYTGRIESSIVARNKNAAASQSIVAALRSGLPLDPSNSEHRKALAGAFAHDTASTAVGSPSWQATAIGYADKARMLPDQAAAWTRQAMRSPDATLAANAAQFYGAVQTAAPDAASSFDEHTKAFAGMVNSMIEAGTNPAKAVEVARSTVFEQKPELTKQRETQYAAGGLKSFAATSDNALKAFIADDFGHWYASNPVATANLSADFNSQAQRYFAHTGDITLARKLAWDDLKRVYGESEVNGTKQVMAFPPERFGVKPEDVRADIGNFLKGNPQADGSGSADVFLVPDALTLRAVGDALTGQNVRPSYKLVTKSGDLVLDRNGVAKRYTLPSGDELAARFKAAQDQAVADAQTMVERARQQREFDKQLEEYKNSTVLP